MGTSQCQIHTCSTHITVRDSTVWWWLRGLEGGVTLKMTSLIRPMESSPQLTVKEEKACSVCAHKFFVNPASFWVQAGRTGWKLYAGRELPYLSAPRNGLWLATHANVLSFASLTLWVTWKWLAASGTTRITMQHGIVNVAIRKERICFYNYYQFSTRNKGFCKERRTVDFVVWASLTPARNEEHQNL